MSCSIKPDKNPTSEAIIRVRWPEGTRSMVINHNRHLPNETVGQAIDSGTYRQEDWPDADELDKSKVTGEVWEVEWYPAGRIGPHRICGASLEYILQEANK